MGVGLVGKQKLGEVISQIHRDEIFVNNEFHKQEGKYLWIEFVRKLWKINKNTRKCVIVLNIIRFITCIEVVQTIL